jgi:hypothetical protein
MRIVKETPMEHTRNTPTQELTFGTALARFREAVADYQRARAWYACAIEEENRIAIEVYTELQRLGGPGSSIASVYLSAVRETYDSAKLRSKRLLAVRSTAMEALNLHHELCRAVGKRDVMRAMGDLDEAFAQTPDAELEARYPTSTRGYPEALHDLVREVRHTERRNKHNRTRKS